MDRAKVTAEARWGWSGAEIVHEPSSAKDQLNSAIALLPFSISPANQISDQLLALGARYHRFLHQDEFGPRRADQLAALRDVVQKLDVIIAQLTKLPDRVREALLNYLSGDEARRSLTQFEDPAFERLYEVAVDATKLFSAMGDAAAISALKDLCAATVEIRASLFLLDTNTSSEVFLDQIQRRVEAVKNPRIDAFDQIAACIGRMHREFQTTCRRLEATKGPKAATSLQWLVWELCDLWTRETRSPVTNSASRKRLYLGEPRKRLYLGEPQSSAGKFIRAAVEALQPPKQWFADHGGSETLPVRAQIIARGPGYRARAVTMAMRPYVADHPRAGPRRGRPKRK